MAQTEKYNSRVSHIIKCHGGVASIDYNRRHGGVASNDYNRCPGGTIVVN